MRHGGTELTVCPPAAEALIVYLHFVSTILIFGMVMQHYKTGLS